MLVGVLVYYGSGLLRDISYKLYDWGMSINNEVCNKDCVVLVVSKMNWAGLR